MTDNQRIAYEWAKSHDYPSIAARYARELAGLVDDLQGAYDAMARDLAARTRQVRQLQEENAALRQQEPNDWICTLKCTALMDEGMCSHGGLCCLYESQRTIKENQPLTLDELRQMDGEPVWCISLLDKSEEWGIMRVIEMAKTWFIAISGASRAFGDKDTYGKTWLAYRQKPEEDDHE